MRERRPTRSAITPDHLAFARTFEHRLARALGKEVRHRFHLAQGRATRERQGQSPPSRWLGPTTPFAALVLICTQADFQQGLPELDSARQGWRLSAEGWQPLPVLPTLDADEAPWWSGLVAVALSPDQRLLALLESWHPGSARPVLFNLIWHPNWLECLPAV